MGQIIQVLPSQIFEKKPFHKFYLVSSLISCPNYATVGCKGFYVGFFFALPCWLFMNSLEMAYHD